MAHLTVRCFSNVLGHCITFEALLPETATNQIGMNSVDGGDTYPVLYLLHGLSDDQTIWMRRTSIERYVSQLGIAVIMPFGERSFYSDMQCGRRYWTFLSEELPVLCRNFFPRISPRREDTFAAGLSMGGYGALKLALRCPDRFAAAASLSGVLDIAAFVRRQLPDNAAFWNAIYASPEELERGEDNLFVAAKKAVQAEHPPKLFACCGREDFLYQDNLTAEKVFRELGVDLTYEEGPGSHTWEFWDQWIRRALEWMPIKR